MLWPSILMFSYSLWQLMSQTQGGKFKIFSSFVFLTAYCKPHPSYVLNNFLPLQVPCRLKKLTLPILCICWFHHVYVCIRDLKFDVGSENKWMHALVRWHNNHQWRYIATVPNNFKKQVTGIVNTYSYYFFLVLNSITLIN